MAQYRYQYRPNLRRYPGIRYTGIGGPICNLTLDEMAIRKHIEWDGSRFLGYVDIGTEVDEASEALVFMLVAFDASWKLPCAYFLVEGLKGPERANLVSECLVKLHTMQPVYVQRVRCPSQSGPRQTTAMVSAPG
jgi:hypothetical protein